MRSIASVIISVLLAGSAYAAPHERPEEFPHESPVTAAEAHYIATWGESGEQSKCPYAFVDSAGPRGLTKYVSADPRLIKVTTRYGLQGVGMWLEIRVRNQNYRLLNYMCSETTFAVDLTTGKAAAMKESSCFRQDEDPVTRKHGMETQEEFEERARSDYIDIMLHLKDAFRHCDKMAVGKENEPYPEAK